MDSRWLAIDVSGLAAQTTGAARMFIEGGPSLGTTEPGTAAAAADRVKRSLVPHSDSMPNEAHDRQPTECDRRLE